MEFWMIPKFLFKDKKMTLSAKVLFGILWTRKNGDNVAWPSQSYIAEQMGGMSKRQIIRIVQELEATGLVTKTRRGLKKSNIYQINIEDILSHQEVTYRPPLEVTLVSLPIVREHREDTNSKDIYAQSFNKFWDEYPKKVAKKKAKQLFERISLDIFDALMGGLARWKESGQWKKNEGEFIPYPATWLSQERWNDEVPKEYDDRPVVYKIK